MMAEMVAVSNSETISSGDSGSAKYSLDFKDPLGVNDHLCAAVDDESDEFDFDVSSVVSLMCAAVLRRPTA